MVFRFGAQNPVGVLARMGGDTWHYREACVVVKQSRAELMAIEWLDLRLDLFAPGLSGSAKKSKGMLEMCNSSINKMASPN